MPVPKKRVTAVPCGPPANASEIKACGHLKSCLQSAAVPAGKDGGKWVLLTNLTFSVTNKFQSDEIDIVAIGPPGVRVIEVKHWTAQWMKDNEDVVEQEAERVTAKAKKIGTRLRKKVPELPHADGVFLLTETPAKVKGLAGEKIRGVGVHTLAEWKDAVDFGTPAALSAAQVEKLANTLEPRSRVALDGSLRRLAGYGNLNLQTPQDGRFHRIYKGIHTARKDRVLLHLYDLSAGGQGADANTRREFAVLHRLQEYTWAPRILDSYQPVQGYAGEMFFFTVTDPVTPNIRARASDDSWDTTARLSFARGAVRALTEMHDAAADGKPILHRNLTPETILVRHDNSPVLSAPILTDGSAAAAAAGKRDATVRDVTVAPEVRAQDLSAADYRSDVYSLCASLRALFQGRQDEESGKALETLAKGMEEEPATRVSLEDLETYFSELLGESAPDPPAPSARFWTEGQIVPFRDRRYRIVDRLGSGAAGALFKVVEIDRSTQEDRDTYAARVEYEQETGRRVLEAYNLARRLPVRHKALAPVFDTVSEWRENAFIALMPWIEGDSLQDCIGMLQLPAEEVEESSGETLALRRLRTMCEALQALHSNGMRHGGVSPRNMIVSEYGLVLTGYDSVSKIEDHIEVDRPQDHAAGLYYPPCDTQGRAAEPADDIYALAASFFHALFDREPFQYDGAQAKERGLNWQGLDGADPILRDFLNKAAHPDPQHRFASAEQALAALPRAESPVDPTENAARTANEAPWLQSLLQSYPGSRWGNRETRGLDTDFAERTYVETDIEKALYDGIRGRRVRLAILCGNAGDGKTALLQHLAGRLSLEKQASSQRILEGTLEDGLVVRMNLDGSAAWQGRTADELLNEFLAPFQEGPPNEDIAHLLAVNDGRLLEWIEAAGETPLVEELESRLEGGPAAPDSHIRFVSLNERSLVGNVAPGGDAIETDFPEQLLDRLYGGEEHWKPCRTCSAQERCEAFRAARVFGPASLPGAVLPEIRARACQRLFAALQAVHLRGETHITVRELRAALVYILFGIHSCRDYHDGREETLPYWDRAFSPESPGRQGEALRELARFDPALEAHPHLDRRLQSASFENGEAPSLESARRRVYFEWTERRTVEAAAGEEGALDLDGGRHLRLFRKLPFMAPEDRAGICKRLCRGISRLEDLPPQALDRAGAALRIVPRTLTETAFWIEKPFKRFRLEADLPEAAEGIERLHRQASLIYRYSGGKEERLTLGVDLFHLLLELDDGYRLGDVSTNDAFARLSIFVQRLT